jgi:LPXTG-motif cell wall-anchored protein
VGATLPQTGASALAAQTGMGGALVVTGLALLLRARRRHEARAGVAR